MTLKTFDANFGFSTDLEQERNRFVNRMGSLFDKFKRDLKFDEYNSLFEKVCYELGENYRKILSDYSRIVRPVTAPSLQVLSGIDFNKVLRLIVALYNSYDGNNYVQHHIISKSVTDALSKSQMDVGVKWVNGSFYPAGEDLLDEQVIEGALKSLHNYPNENKDITIALTNYQSGRLDGVIENCYLAIEGLTRKVLKNDRTLLNNKVELLQLVGSSRYWGKIVSAYIEYANEMRRHASEERHNLKANEVEGFLYLTCLIIRLVIQSIS
jgi:hypothetical protein